MALTFPLALAVFADILPIEEVAWELRLNQETSLLGSGEILPADVAPPLWTAAVRLGFMTHAEADRVQALIESLRGNQRSFYLYSPRRLWPQADPGGAMLGSSSVTVHTIGAELDSLRLTGLPAGYVLSVGDMLAFDHGSPARRALHRVIETTTADGAGLSPSFQVEPSIRPGLVTETAVSLAKPAAKVSIVPGSFDPGRTRQSVVRGMGFSVLQRL